MSIATPQQATNTDPQAALRQCTPSPAADARDYDCIVIGAGMSGLTFAALMAQAGKRVLVVEKHYLPGGCFTAFKRFDAAGAYIFNVAMEWTTDGGEGEAFSNLLSQLGLSGQYSFRKLSHFRSVLGPELPDRIDLLCSEQAFCARLAMAFPSQRNAIERFVADCVDVANHAPRANSILFKSGIRHVELALANYFDDPLLIQLFYGLLDYPSARGVHLMFLVGSICSGNVYMPVHGDQRRLASLLHRRIRKCGGDVRYSTTVDEILVDTESQARGVRLAGGEALHAPIVVSCTDTAQLYQTLLGGRHSHGVDATKAIAREPGPSSFCLFLALDGQFPELTADNHSYLLLAETAGWQADKASFHNAPLRVDFQSALYPELAPAGKTSICVRVASYLADFDHWGQSRDCAYEDIDRVRYEVAKTEATEALLRRVLAAFPALAGSVQVLDAATPFTIRRYTHNTMGAIGAGLNDLRSVAQSNARTPVKGVYHVGHWTVASGVNSVMYSAHNLYRSMFG